MQKQKNLNINLTPIFNLSKLHLSDMYTSWFPLPSIFKIISKLTIFCLRYI